MVVLQGSPVVHLLSSILHRPTRDNGRQMKDEGRSVERLVLLYAHVSTASLRQAQDRSIWVHQIFLSDLKKGFELWLPAASEFFQR